MLLLASSSFPRYGLERFFQFAQAAGYPGVEITINQNFDTQDPTYLQKLASEYNVEIRAFSLPETAPEKYMAAFQETVRNFEQAHLNLSSPEIFSYQYKRWLTKTIPKLAKKYNLRPHRKNSEFKTFLGVIPLRAENSLHSLKMAGTVSLDLSALWSSNEEIMRTIPFFGSRLQHVYLSNVLKGRAYAPPMHGILPLESFLTKLAQQKFKGDMTLRLNPKMMHEGDEGQMMDVLKDSKAFYDEYFTQAH